VYVGASKTLNPEDEFWYKLPPTVPLPLMLKEALACWEVVEFAMN
jgi:hypothetical protein